MTGIITDIYMEQWNIIESRNKPVDIGWIDLWQGSQEHTMGKEQSHQQIMLGKLDVHMQKNKIELLYHIQKSTQNGLMT